MEAHHNELMTSFKLIRLNIENNRRRSTNPRTIANQIFKALKRNPNDFTAFRKKPIPGKTYSLGDRLRKFANFYYWRAEKTSVCRGALYRSKAFMQIDMGMRSGYKIDRNQPFGVHIEHTIPVNAIEKSLWNARQSLKSPEDIFNFLIRRSVCTALTREEEKTAIRPGHSRAHPDMADGKTCNLKEIYPFRRYDFSNGLEIFDVLNQTKIDPKSWTLQDHVDLLDHDIFRWDTFR